MIKKSVCVALPVHILYIFCTFSLFSCIGTKSVVYFHNLSDSVNVRLSNLQPPSPVIQANDIIEIRIGGENERTVQYMQSYFTGGQSLKAMVDIDGNIVLPKVGKIHVAGLSKEAVTDTLTNAYKEYLVDPIIQITLDNFHFTVLGEVGTPGSFDLPVEKITILEAIGQAGDMTSFSQRDKVKIIRDLNGNRQIISMDLTDTAFLNSPDYYIRRHDIIYVTPKYIKQTNDNLQRVSPYIGIAASVLSLIFLISRK